MSAYAPLTPLLPAERPAFGLPVTERVRLMLALARTWHGQVELPGRPNRGPLPDLVNRRWGSPLGSSWCGTSAGALREWAGLWVPERDVGDCDAWRYFGDREGLFRSQGELPLERAPAGSVALYHDGAWSLLTTGPYAGGGRRNVVHVGLLAAIDPLQPRRAFEGNTSLAGFASNGGGFFEKRASAPRYYGCVLPA